MQDAHLVLFLKNQFLYGVPHLVILFVPFPLKSLNVIIAAVFEPLSYKSSIPRVFIFMDF